MILPIYVEPNPILHQKATPISQFGPELRQLAADMRETMHNAVGIGLAAPQIGQSIALLVVELVDQDDPELAIPFIALVNPRITWKSLRQETMLEACLSVPGVEGNVRRPSRIRVKAQDLEGNKIEIEASEMFARVLQHEIDHLNGILFTSNIPKKRLLERPLIEYPQIHA